ncbi:MAG: SprT-like domain-containing protein [Agarilytica sp.]
MSTFRTSTSEAYGLFEKAYSFFNEKLFENTLPPCIITFQRQARMMGYVSFKRWVNTEGKTIDELAINPTYFANYHISSILQTLCHEMVHIWQEHFGKPTRSGYHNQEWSNKMRKIGLMPSSTGEPGGAMVGQNVSDYVLEGGAFEKACGELLSSGFKLHWYDAVPLPPPTPRQQNKVQSNVISLESKIESRLLSNIDEKEIYTDFPVDLADLARRLEEHESETSTPNLPPRVQTSKIKNRSNRHKYVCPSCFMQVWGKPDLDVKCGKCDANLYEQD